jgi:hypothetical protein
MRFFAELVLANGLPPNFLTKQINNKRVNLHSQRRILPDRFGFV